MERMIELWGSYPPPIGGVSIHIKRLIAYLNQRRKVYLKNFKGTPIADLDYVVNVSSVWKEFFLLVVTRKKLIHLHTNNMSAFVLIFFLGFRHRIGITLHNKNLGNLNSCWKRIFLHRFLNRMSFIILNDPQYKECLKEKYKINDLKFHILPAFLPPLGNERKGISDVIQAFRDSHSYLISANAFKLRYENSVDIYGFDSLIELVNYLKQKGINVGLMFCLPQIGDYGYYKICLDKIKRMKLSDNIMIIQDTQLNGFEIWEISHLFVRPTTTDIEGVSIKEALCCNVPVVATDVCVRPPEVLLYKSNDNSDLFKKVDQCYEDHLAGRRLDLKFNEGENTVERILKIYDNFI